jgi:hypothetical protein
MPLVDAEPCTLAIVRRRDVAVSVADELITQSHSGSAS